MTLRILVVDDDESIRKLLALSLPLGIPDVEVVGEAADGEEAVSEARRLTPDLIVLDHMMPRRTGADAIPELREVCPQTQILMFTAYLDSPEVGEEIRERTQKFGIRSLPKGSLQDLEATVSGFAKAHAH